VSASWRSRLAGLNEQEVRDALDGVLDERRIKALLKRRDRMLK
jgi:hypothetical protein